MPLQDSVAASPASGRTFEELAEAKHRARAKALAFVWDPRGEGQPRSVSRLAPTPPSRPTRVLLSDSGKTPFSSVQDPRIHLVPMSAALDHPPDVLVVTHADRLRLNESCKDVPSQVWARLAAGEATLVFDASGEGAPHKPGRTALLHSFLRDKGISLDAAAYITQDREYGRHYAEHCGPGQDRMRVWIFDRYVRELFSHTADRGEVLFDERFALYRARSPCRTRRFISLNFSVRPVRALFLLSLLRDRLWDQGFISVGEIGLANGGRKLSRDQFLDRLRECAGLESLADELAPYLDELERRAPTTLGVEPSADPKTFRRALLQAVPLAEYQQSWFTVVIDSHVSDRLHRITEKPFKPLLNFHPMILLGAVGARRLVEAYGFESFPGMFDETFDEAPTLRERFHAAYRQVRHLCQIPEEELAKLEASVRSAVLFNAWWGLVELPQLFRSHIDAALVDELLDLVSAREETALRAL